jgi:hypothetical protein
VFGDLRQGSLPLCGACVHVSVSAQHRLGMSESPCISNRREMDQRFGCYLRLSYPLVVCGAFEGQASEVSLHVEAALVLGARVRPRHALVDVWL